MVKAVLLNIHKNKNVKLGMSSKFVYQITAHNTEAINLKKIRKFFKNILVNGDQ